MANMRYFNGSRRVDNPHGMDKDKFAALFPGVVGLRIDHRTRWVGYLDRRLVPIERQIEFKRNASRHACDARCLNASGKTMRCECSCGGENHGRGSFICKAA